MPDHEPPEDSDEDMGICSFEDEEQYDLEADPGDDDEETDDAE